MEKTEKKVPTSSAVIVEKIEYPDGIVYYLVRNPHNGAVAGVYTSIEELSTFLAEL